MRLATVLVVLSLSPLVHADAGRRQVEAYGLDPELVPVACQNVVTGTRMGARISVASCTAKLELGDLDLDDSIDSVRKMQRAVRFSMELLDSVSTCGTPIERAEALRAKADQYSGMVARMRGTAPYLSWHLTGSELERAHARHDAIEAAIAPWVLAAATADDTILRIAHDHPEVRRDSVASIAVTTAERVVTARR
jgi:hypothetical protein